MSAASRSPGGATPARMRLCLAKVGMSGKSLLPDVKEMRGSHGRTGKIRQRLQPVSAAVLQRAADLVRQPARWAAAHDFADRLLRFACRPHAADGQRPG